MNVVYHVVFRSDLARFAERTSKWRRAPLPAGLILVRLPLCLFVASAQVAEHLAEDTDIRTPGIQLGPGFRFTATEEMLLDATDALTKRHGPRPYSANLIFKEAGLKGTSRQREILGLLDRLGFLESSGAGYRRTNKLRP
jgi:hypothetical protein